MGKIRHLEGKKFNKLTVLRKSEIKRHRKTMWECECECGNKALVNTNSLETGNTKSCGCLSRPDLVGKQFGKLEVVSQVESKKSERRWKCRCDCGNIHTASTSQLNLGVVKSCGCYRKNFNKTHGLSKTPEHKIWLLIRYRCNSEKSDNYENYGGRGIKVCERWDKFENFLEDMGPRPSPKHSVDRIDVNGNYCPENCEWATRHQQSINRRDSIKYTGTTKMGRGFVARIRSGKEKLHLGTFDTVLEAAKAYDDKCEDLHGYRPNNT